MVFTGAQLTAFFENNPQMALNPTQRQRLADEGLALVSDFQDFKEDELEQAYKNMRISIPGVAATTDATGNIIAPAIQAIPPCIIPARCILRLKIASIAYQYYINTGREVNSTNMHYSNILRKFHTEWEALKKLSKQDRPDVPVLVKVLEQSTCLQRVGHPNSLSRRLPTNDRMLRYRRIDSNFFTDTFFATAKGKSSRGHTCAQLFVSDKGYLSIYFMKSKSEFKDALHLFCKEVGVPVNLVVDPSKEQTSNDVKQFCHKVGTTLRILEESTQWANRAERYIGIFKESIRQDMRIANSPLCLWDYCAERRALIHNVIPKGLFQLQGSNPITSTFGFQPDISNICQFEWYSWCYFREESNVQFPFQKEQLGRVLGPLRNEGNAMTQAILRINGRVVPRRTVRPLTVSEIQSPVEIKKREEFDKSITKLLGNCKEPLPSGTKLDQDSMPTLDDFMCEEDGNISLPPSLLDDPVDFTGKAVYDQPPTDALINMEILLPQGEEFQRATVKRRATDHEGKLVGEFNENPLLNTAVYDVELSDGVVREYSANIIAENIYQQVDSNGYTSSTIDCIVDYSRDSNAISKSNKYVKTKSGQRRLRKTTAG